MDSGATLPQLRGSELVGESWSFLKGHLGSLARASTFPLVLSLLISLVVLVATNAEASSEAVVTARSLLYVLPWTIFGVTWHRQILSDEAASVSVEWSSIHSRFAVFLVLWHVPYLVLSMLEQSSEFAGLSVVVFMAEIAVFYVQARFSLFLPATAIAQPISPSDAWSTSRGYGGAIFWAGVLSAIIGLLLCSPLLVASFFLQQHSSVAAQLALVPLQLVFEALAVGALSFAYKAICAQPSVDQQANGVDVE